MNRALLEEYLQLKEEKENLIKYLEQNIIADKNIIYYDATIRAGNEVLKEILEKVKSGKYENI